MCAIYNIMCMNVRVHIYTCLMTTDNHSCGAAFNLFSKGKRQKYSQKKKETNFIH